MRISRGAAESRRARGEEQSPQAVLDGAQFSASSAAPRDEPGFAVLVNWLGESAILSAASLAVRAPYDDRQSPVVSPESSVPSP